MLLYYFSALDISSWKTASSSAASNLQHNWPMETGKKHSKGVNVYHLLLPISALLSTTTFHIQLKILGCRAEDAYEYNSSSLSPFCQIVNQHPYFIPSVIVFNSLAFFISVALMMILFSELPLWPLSLVSAFSMAAAYICTMSDSLKPLLSSSSLVNPVR
ncbi:hypothetical protein CUMW_280850 [Citrus unshiu]|uniref:PGG domain-containing protein n=1 Tax=Citrus unshiu TaxID=55188 RepID=A0A2H5MX46_CITUN|nr:hypothetical protein CUMW_280850 [Citrus unshiu]